MHNLFTGKNAVKWLLASLLLNMFLLGVAAAPMFFRPMVPPPLMPPPPQFMIERLSESLSEVGRHELLWAFEKSQPQLDQLFGDLNQTQQDLIQIFAAEAFDESAYRRALDARKVAADKFFSRMSDFFLHIGMKLSAEDRLRITERGRI